MILVVGFMAMITAITIGSELLATARRQTIAAQLIANEIDYARLKLANTVNTLPSATGWSAGTTYAIGNITQYRGARFRCVQAHTASASLVPPVSPSYWVAYMTFDTGTVYIAGDVVSYGGLWYRYINPSSSSGNLPSNTTYWKGYDGPTSNGVADGVTFTLTRGAQDLVGSDFREVTVVVSWTKSGTATAASAPAEGWLDSLAFSRPSPISRSYSRSTATIINKYGLNLDYQR